MVHEFLIIPPYYIDVMHFHSQHYKIGPAHVLNEEECLRLKLKAMRNIPVYHVAKYSCAWPWVMYKIYSYR